MTFTQAITDVVSATGRSAARLAPRLPALGVPDRPAWASRVILATVIATAGLFTLGCGRQPSQPPTKQRLLVVAGVPPIAYLAEQIGGDRVQVEILVRPGQDPHTFQPTPRDVSSLNRASLFLEIGMPFESVLVTAIRQANPRLKVVEVAAGVRKRMADAHDHGHEDERGQPDPHVWLSPPLLKIQAKNVAGAFAATDPAHAAEYRRNLSDLLQRIDATHRRIEKMMSPYRGRSFVVFHPAFGYFADAYGLTQEPVEAGGRQPGPRQLRTLIEKAKADGITTIFAQPEFDPRSAKIIAEQIGGQVVTINGLAKNVLADVQDIAEQVEKSFQEIAPRKHEERKESNHSSGVTPNRQDSLANGNEAIARVPMAARPRFALSEVAFRVG